MRNRSLDATTFPEAFTLPAMWNVHDTYSSGPLVSEEQEPRLDDEQSSFELVRLFRPLDRRARRDRAPEARRRIEDRLVVGRDDEAVVLVGAEGYLVDRRGSAANAAHLVFAERARSQLQRVGGEGSPQLGAE
jgi:hypothetical protein